MLSLCCSEVRQSEHFAKVLKWVHVLGNMLNEGTRLASAGFSLESLPTVCNDNKKPFLTFPVV